MDRIDRPHRDRDRHAEPGRRGRGRRAEPGGQDRDRHAEPGACRSCRVRDEAHYPPLVRLAALLTGDAEIAEAVAAEVLLRAPCPAQHGGDSERCLAYLQQQVLARARRRRHRPAPGRPDSAEFASLPVVVALRRLPPRVREAVVLTYFLDLPTAKAAAIAGVSEAALRANLAAAMRALEGKLTGL